MIDAKDAVKKAKEYLNEMLHVKSDEIKLEEIELDDEAVCWLVTLSYIEHDAFDMTYHKRFKIFHVNANTSEVVSMKIKVFK